MKLKHIFMPVLYVEELFFSFNKKLFENRTYRLKCVISYLCCEILDGVGKSTPFFLFRCSYGANAFFSPSVNMRNM